MKDTQKRFLGAVLAASSVAGIVAPSVTAMAAVSEEIKATPEELRGVINENLPKLKEDPKFSTFHKIKFAADRLRDYNNLADEAAKVMAEIAPYSEKVHTTEIIAIVDAMDKFGQEKNMASYDKILNTDLVALAKTDKDSADYLTQRLDSWGTDVVFKADENYSKATNAIIKVTELRKDGKLDEAKDQVDVAKKAISEIKLAVNKPYLEALLQVEIDAIEDAIAKQDLHVTSVVAKNGKEIEVKFNKTVSKDSAENKDHYALTKANSDAKDVTVKKAELQDDNKTVVITLVDDNNNGTTLNNKTNAKYLVKVQDVLTENDEDMEDYSEIVSLFDNVKPEVTGLEYTDSDTVRINFSEPINAKNGVAVAPKVTVKLNGANVNVNSSAFKLDEDKLYLEISKSKANLDDSKNYTVEIDGLTDYASNALTKFNGDINFGKDDTDPTVEKIEALSKDAFKVTFSEKITKLDKDTFKNEEIFKVSLDSNRTVKSIKHNEDGDDRDYKTFIVELNTVKDGNDIVTISAFEDLAGNSGDTKTEEVKFEESHPVLETKAPEYKTIDGNKYAVYSFDRDVKVDSKNTVKVKHIDSDGVTITTPGKELKDSTMKDSKGNDFDVESNEIALDIDVLEEGNYNFDLEKENVVDLYRQNVEKVNLEFIKSAKGAKIQVKSIVNGKDDKDDKVQDNNKVVVTFSGELTKQAIKDAANAKNYRVDGVQVFEKAEVKKDVTGKITNTVELTVEENAISTTGKKVIDISGIDGVEDFNQNYIGEKETENNAIILTENKKASINEAVAVSYDTIKLTMSEDIETVTGAPIEVKVNDDDATIKPLVVGENVKGNVITITLDKQIKSSDKIKVKVFDEDTRNLKDEAGNKTKEVTEDVKVEYDESTKIAQDAVDELEKSCKDLSTSDKVNIAEANAVLAQSKVDKVKNASEKSLLQNTINDCKTKISAVKDLAVAISDAQKAHDDVTVKEGKEAGNTIEGSKTTLDTAIKAAQAVIADKDSATKVLTEAKTTLNTAVDTFKVAKVVEIKGLVAPKLTLATPGTTDKGSITGYEVLKGETLNVTSSTTDVTVDAATGLAVTGANVGSSVITVQVKNAAGDVIKTGIVTVTVTA